MGTDPPPSASLPRLLRGPQGTRWSGREQQRIDEGGPAVETLLQAYLQERRIKEPLKTRQRAQDAGSGLHLAMPLAVS